MKKTLKTVIIFLVLIILGINSEVYAATTTFKANSTTVNVGDEIIVTATVTAAQWDLKIKLNGTTLAESSELENYESNITKTITAKYKTTEKGKLEFVLEGDITDVNQENKTINDKVQVTVNEKVVTPTPTPTATPTATPTQAPTTETKSSEARLKTFGITPDEYDFSGFSKNRNKENWSATVPNNVSEVEVYATALGKNAKVEGTGKVTLKEGDNTVKVIVTAEDGTTKTYTLTIKRKTAEEQAKENGEVRLKNLGIKPEEYDFTGFNSDQTEYNVEVPNEVEEIEVYATAMNSNAQITGTGMIELAEGVNELLIDVIAIDGTKKTYTLKVTRKESEEVVEITEKFGLEKLLIQGLKLSPTFKNETYEYTATLQEDLNSLEITAKANKEDTTVEIVGNENLQQGENVITILVTDKDTQDVVTYQITIDKKLAVQEIEETVQKSWLKPETWGKEEKIKIAIIIVLLILIIWVIILKIKISKEDNKITKPALPGGEQLDKAITEHQELSGDLNQNDVEKNYIEEITNNRLGMKESTVEEKTRKRGRHF